MKITDKSLYFPTWMRNFDSLLLKRKNLYTFANSRIAEFLRLQKHINMRIDKNKHTYGSVKITDKFC